MNIQEQIKNLSDRELIEKFKRKEEYFQNVKEMLENEMLERKLLSKEKITQKQEAKIKTLYKNKNKFFWNFVYILVVILIVKTKISLDIKDRERRANLQKQERVYSGEYMGKIEEKYPKEFAKAKTYRQIILKSIKSNKKTRDKNNFYIEYFDEKGRLVYEIKQLSKVFDYERKYHGTKGESIDRGKEIVNPEEVGYIYDVNNNIKIKIYRKSSGTSTIDSLDENTWDSFLKNGWSEWELQIFEYRDISENEKIMTEEKCILSEQYFNRKERRYINNTLVSEKELVDREDSDSFMMLNTEKRYNKDGKLIYKTVERIDKTNGYKSFTEMDFEKHKVVTKYYKDQKVMATVTEDFLGEEKTMLELKMIRGEEISHLYKMQEKSIVKREKKGSSLLIYDVFTYGQKDEGEFFDRYIVDKGKLVYIFEHCKSDWVWEYTRYREGLDENSCYIDHIKNERMLMISELGDYKKYEYDKVSGKYNLIQNYILDSNPESEGTWRKGGQYIHKEFAQGIVNTDFDKKVNVKKSILRKGIDEKEIIFSEKEFYKKIESTLDKSL